MTPITIWELGHKSQEFELGPIVRLENGQLVIAYDYETDAGAYGWEEMSFAGIRGFSFTAAPDCSEDQVAAYDRVQQIDSSPWLARTADAPKSIHHYRIYFDDVGCYDVLAATFEPPPSVRDH